MKMTPMAIVEGRGKSSSAKVLDAFKDHIKPGSTLIHDLDFSHYELIARLKLADQGEKAIYRFDCQSGLDPINAYCSNMYSEDNLLCYLLRKNGYKLINNPNAKIIHLEGRSDSSVYSKQKIQNVVFGDYIRQLRAYGFKKAKKFLKTASKVYRRAYLRKKIFHKSGWENDKRLSEEYARFFAEVNSVI